MNVSFELIIPPVILGMLTVMILNLNASVMSSSAENRLTYQLQERAKLTITLVESESRSLTDIISVTNSDFIFVTAQRDTVHIYRDNKNMVVAKTLSDGTSSTEEYPLKLSDLVFDWDLSSIAFVEIRAVTESDPSESAGRNIETYNAVVERELFYQNLNF
jgi:hypothetical protein